MVKLYFSEEQVISAIQASASTKDFLIQLGMKVNNGNYRKAEEICRLYGLSVPKHNSKLNGGTLSNFNKLPDEEFFVEGVLRNGSSIKKRLINDHGYSDECSECGQLPAWNGKPLTLQIDHIDGNRFNNKISNLRILCGHCHSQTKTFSNKEGVSRYNYCECGIRIGKNSKTCKDCSVINLAKSNVGKTKIEYPPISELLQEINGSSFTAVANRLGVSDNAIRKHIKRVAGKDAVPKGYAKNPKQAPLTSGRKFLSEANVNDVISIIETPGNSVKSFASSINVDVKYLRNWISDNLGHDYVAPRNKQTLNPLHGKIEYPSVDDILSSIANNGAESTARSLGVTSKAVERHLRKHLPATAFPLLRSGFLEKYKLY